MGPIWEASWGGLGTLFSSKYDRISPYSPICPYGPKQRYLTPSLTAQHAPWDRNFVNLLNAPREKGTFFHFWRYLAYPYI